jgi:hypothetical protein
MIWYYSNMIPLPRLSIFDLAPKPAAKFILRPSFNESRYKHEIENLNDIYHLEMILLCKSILKIIYIYL